MASPELSNGSFEPAPEGSSFSDDMPGTPGSCSESEVDEPISKRQKVLSTVAAPAGATAATPQLKKPKQKRVAAGKKAAGSKAPPLPKILKAFDNDQLVELILKLVNDRPELQEVVVANLPKPDLAKTLKRLDQLERNIWRAMPNTRFGSGRDAFCYRRCSVHVGALKKAILEEGRNLVTSAAWPTVLEYVLSAAGTASGAPTWDDASKNNQKVLTYKALDGYLKQAATKGKGVLEKEACTEAIQKLSQYGTHFSGSLEALAKLV